MQQHIYIKKHYKLIIFLIIILQIFNAIIWGSKKEGYYIDELWSYGLANSYYQPFLQNYENYMNHWLTPDFYTSYITVGSDETFSFDSVYYNQVNDVHPPLFYMLLHTVSSFFPSTFSKWIGLSINLVFFIGSVWLVYLISKKLLGENKIMALIPVICYGFSTGALSIFLYIRMYMILCFLTLLYLYMTLCLMDEQNKHAKILTYLGLALSATAGILTQYYFVIFAFFVSATFVCIQLFQKKWTQILWYSISSFAGLGIGIALFPHALSHVFANPKGHESISNLTASIHSLISRLLFYCQLLLNKFFSMSDELTPWISVFLVGAFFLFGAYILIRHFIHKKATDVASVLNLDKWAILFITFYGYFVIISFISTDKVDRYQFPVYALFVILLCTAVIYLCSLIKKKILVWIFLFLYLTITFYGYHHNTVNYIYYGYQNVLDNIQNKYSSVPGIYITKGDHLVIDNCLFLSSQKDTYALTPEQIDLLPTILEEKESGSILVYVDIYFDEKSTVEQIADMLHYSSVEFLYDNMFTEIYVLSDKTK